MSAMRFLLALLLATPAFASETGTYGSVTSGKDVFMQWCWECHGSDNPHGSGTWSLKRSPGDSRSPYLEMRYGLTNDYVSLVVRQGLLFMPAFRQTEISDAELQALANYLSSEASE